MFIEYCRKFRIFVNEELCKLYMTMIKEKLSIIAIFTVLSLLCFSQARERVNGDALLYDSLATENHSHDVNLLDDSVRITVRRDYAGNPHIGSYYHIVENKSEQNMVVFFIEDENDTLPQVKLLRRKLYRRYGDFYFFMIEWEANMHIEKSPTVTPDLFVKILKSGEKFELFVPFTDEKEEQIASEVSRHLLVCSEALFSCDEIGMPHYLENLQLYDIAYDSSKVVISADAFKSFLSESE